MHFLPNIFFFTNSHVSVSLQRMYYEASKDGAEEEELSLKNTIQILKESGLVVGSNNEHVDGRTGEDSKNKTIVPTPPRKPLFPDDS